MTQDKQTVLAKYPNACVIYNTDTNTFKIFHTMGECRVALSASYYYELDAWKDAAVSIQRPQVALSSTKKTTAGPMT